MRIREYLNQSEKNTTKLKLMEHKCQIFYLHMDFSDLPIFLKYTNGQKNNHRFEIRVNYRAIKEKVQKIPSERNVSIKLKTPSTATQHTYDSHHEGFYQSEPTGDKQVPFYILPTAITLQNKSLLPKTLPKVPQ